MIVIMTYFTSMTMNFNTIISHDYRRMTIECNQNKTWSIQGVPKGIQEL